MANSGIKPTLLNAKPFDATLPYSFQFTYMGNQINQVTLTVQGTDSPIVITAAPTLDKDGFMSIQLPANSLTNAGASTSPYTAKITVVEEITGLESLESNEVGFYCFKTPVFTFNGLSTTQTNIVDTTFRDVQLSYSQENGEPLNFFRVYLYDGSKTNIVYQTETVYDTSDLSVTLKDLEDNKQYYVYATGETVHGIWVETAFAELAVEYSQSSIFSTLELENVFDEGYIKIGSNVVIVEGVVSGGNFVGSDDDQQYDVTDDGSSIIFNEGFSIDDDFTVSLICSAPNENSTLLTLSNGKESVELKYLAGMFGVTDTSPGTKQYYFALYARGTVTYCLMSEPMKEKMDKYEILVRRENFLYHLIVREPKVNSMNQHAADTFSGGDE